MSRKRPRTDYDPRPRTVSLSLRDRGQTTQDFAIGIGVFILAVALVFSFIPTVLTPFDSSITGGKTAQADRIADRVVHDLSASTDGPPEIDGDRFQDEYAADDANLSEKVGLRSADQVNIRFESLNDTIDGLHEDWSAGREYRDQSAASSARIVRFDESGPSPAECDTACRLVVRVW